MVGTTYEFEGCTAGALDPEVTDRGRIDGDDAEVGQNQEADCVATDGLQGSVGGWRYHNDVQLSCFNFHPFFVD